MRIVSALSFLAALAISSSPLLAQAGPAVGTVYAMTNAVSGNEVVSWDRDAAGHLTLSTSYATNGLGTGMDLGSQGSIALGRNTEEWLVAVNAGSDEVSLFKRVGQTLQLADTVASGGDQPVSVALRKDVVYVLNAGAPANITGFQIDAQGKLMPIANSTQLLSAPDPMPAQIGWSPTGDLLVVTEKETNMIDVFEVDATTMTPGTLSAHPSAGETPFGFAFLGVRQALVSEAFDGLPDASAVTSYVLLPSTADVLDPSVKTTETAACWLVITRNRHFAYTANTGSDSITGLSVGGAGKLTLLNPDGVTATTGTAPADLALVQHARYLYVRNGMDGTISGYSIDRSTGSLSSLGPAVTGLPAAGSAGLVGR